MSKYNYAFSHRDWSRRKGFGFSLREKFVGLRVSHQHDCRRKRSLVHRIDPASHRIG